MSAICSFPLQNKQMINSEKLQFARSYIHHNISTFLKDSEKFSYNESKYIIRNALLYLLPHYKVSLDLDYSKDEHNQYNIIKINWS